MRFYYPILFFIFYGSLTVKSQESLLQKDSITSALIMVPGDSIFRTSIALKGAYVFGKRKFENKESKLRYYILKRKTHKVYPYAKLAAERLVALNDSLVHITKPRKRKRFTRKIQKFIEEEFSEELKKLTRTEGQILVKLIYRQTGTTAFNLVKDLRNGWRAFSYNTTAKMFDISLKEEYDPTRVQEDYLIEDILLRAFAKEKLQRQETVLDYDYFKLSNKWQE